MTSFRHFLRMIIHTVNETSPFTHNPLLLIMQQSEKIQPGRLWYYNYVRVQEIRKDLPNPGLMEYVAVDVPTVAGDTMSLVFKQSSTYAPYVSVLNLAIRACYEGGAYTYTCARACSRTRTVTHTPIRVHACIYTHAPFAL